MTAENYDLLVFAALGLAGIFFIFSIVLFIRYNIPKVLGDITGTSTKRGILKKQEEKVARKENTVKTKKKAKKRAVSEPKQQIQTPVQEETMLLNEPVADAVEYQATEVLSEETENIHIADNMMIQDDITMTDTMNIIE